MDVVSQDMNAPSDNKAESAGDPAASIVSVSRGTSGGGEVASSDQPAPAYAFSGSENSSANAAASGGATVSAAAPKDASSVALAPTALSAQNPAGVTPNPLGGFQLPVSQGQSAITLLRNRCRQN